MKRKYGDKGNDCVCDMGMRIGRSNGGEEWLREGFVKLV